MHFTLAGMDKKSALRNYPSALRKNEWRFEIGILHNQRLEPWIAPLFQIYLLF
jgi:hypothetical protein